MKVAVPIWTGRVSPVLDVARQLVVADLEGGNEISRQKQALPETDAVRRADSIRKLGVDVLICGAVSRPLENMLRARGVEVIPWICGPVDNVLELFISGQPLSPNYLMPGCCGRGRRGLGRGGRRRGWYPR